MEWVYITALGIILITILIFVIRALSVNRGSNNDEYEVESEITSFINEFKHIANLKIDLLTEKEEQVREVIKEANSMIVRLNAVVADAQKILENLRKQEKGSELQHKIKDIRPADEHMIREQDIDANITEAVLPSPRKTNSNVDYELLKKRVAELARDNWKTDDIARMLGIGIRETKLMLNLAFARHGEQYPNE